MTDNLNRRTALKGALGAGVLGALTLGQASSAEATSINLPLSYIKLPVSGSTCYYSGIPWDHTKEMTDSIKHIQLLLGVERDGVYGPKTADAVRAAQRWNRITVDGRVGSQTAAAMGLHVVH